MVFLCVCGQVSGCAPECVFTHVWSPGESWESGVSQGARRCVSCRPGQEARIHTETPPAILKLGLGKLGTPF